MTCSAVIFDLDGTLLDTLEDLGSSVNRVLAGQGFATHPLEAFRWFVGDGSRMLITRALPAEQRSPGTIESSLAALLADYNRNWHHQTRPYDGIEALLAALTHQGKALSVVTNKPHRFTREMVAHYFPSIAFRAVLGQQDGIAKKPDPVQALAAARAMGVAPEACIFLGDSGVDMQTAGRAGMLGVGAAWGFRPVEELKAAGARHIVHHPLELLSFVAD
ncbi:MAG: HAD family hydrolase [Desulfobacterales bacterium]|nr:HAD family hydrolase [Desulfobacterales bacterium]